MSETQTTASKPTGAPGNSGAFPPGENRKHYKFAAEFGSKKNNNFIWPPDQREIRGRWSRDNLAGVGMDDRFAAMPSLPGLVLSVDTKAAVISISDPLTAEKFKDATKKVTELVLAVFGDKQGPEKEHRITRCHEDVLKQYCYWARRFLDNGQFHLRGDRIIEGTIPTMEEVNAMPGFLLVGVFDSNPKNRERRKSHDGYQPPTKEIVAGAFSFEEAFLEDE